MAKIILSYRKDEIDSVEIPTYNLSFYEALIATGDHEVIRVGEGHPIPSFFGVSDYKSYDLFIDLDCGRNKDGKLHFQFYEEKCPIPSVFRSIDSHGYRSLHHRLVRNYSHVFFAVWDCRDLFSKHPSAHWCPNASDDTWFDYTQHPTQWACPKIDFGFFGSKGGLDRADDLKFVCNNNRSFNYDVREIGRAHKVRWPRTAESMAQCKVLFNRGQKHDGPNQRVIESMLMNKPLLTDRDKRDGMAKLFQEGEHFLGYENRSELGNQVDWMMREENEPLLQSMAARAYNLVKEKHLVKHRVAQILEVCL